ncbi:pilus assembly protein TadG-related protein [Brevibacillus ruminantium]|uniref:Pilus assembly protein TadG-related protein n=1 Tax=Brevibacillus ruminantium TaxID=2950604 RepID=A0ABY4WK01_9BACL|nr:pilus assembly protein TadG-related protein [Brevibacillus ruminantium]USG65674.1 pilus assembly protein TadG-related protein [Brevibacillus ruminantium]
MKNRVFSVLKEERGNMLVFSLTIFTFMLLVMFAAVYNFSTVFVGKDKAMNSAQQASIGAIKSVYDAMEEAILAYDAWASVNFVPPISPDVDERERALRSANRDWASSEVRYTAIDQIFTEQLGSRPMLASFVMAGLARAKAEIPGVVAYILGENNASLEYVTTFNGDDRIEVEASIQYRVDKLGLDFFPNYSEKIVQTGESRRIGFLRAL